MPGEISSTGTESEYDWVTAVMALSTAGPLVVRQTPGLPVTRA
nr:hypothetical protein [Lentzea aerocolonigenes]